MNEITFRVIPSLNIVHFQGTGDVSYEMIIENTLELHKHPDWKPHYNSFIDFENAIVNAHFGGFEKYQSFFCDLQDKTPPRKWAIFTTQDITHQNANMSHLLNSQSIIVDVFQNKKDALYFLDISLEQFDNERK